MREHHGDALVKGEVDEDGDPIIGSFSSNEVLLTTVDIEDMTIGSEVSFSLDFTYETFSFVMQLFKTRFMT